MAHNEVETRNTKKANEKATMLMVQFTLLERFNQETMRKKVKHKKKKEVRCTRLDVWFRILSFKKSKKEKHGKRNFETKVHLEEEVHLPLG